MYGYVYLTTNKVNGKKYIGQHKSSTYDKNYIGSGIVFKKAVDLYQKHNFSIEVLCECDSKDELDNMEIYYISKFDAVNSKDFYNVSSGGYHKGNRGLVAMYNIDTDEIILSPKGLIHSNEELGFSLGSRPRSDESKERYRNSKKDLTPMTDGTKTIYAKKQDIDSMIEVGFRVGRIPTRPNQKEEGRKWMNKDGKSIMVKEDEIEKYISDGYSFGRVKFSHFNRVAPQYNAGKRLMKKEDATQWVEKEKVEQYKLDGWVVVRKR